MLSGATPVFRSERALRPATAAGRHAIGQLLLDPPPLVFPHALDLDDGDLRVDGSSVKTWTRISSPDASARARTRPPTRLPPCRRNRSHREFAGTSSTPPRSIHAGRMPATYRASRGKALDDDAVLPHAVQPPVAGVDAHLAEALLAAHRAAGRVLGEDRESSFQKPRASQAATSAPSARCRRRCPAPRARRTPRTRRPRRRPARLRYGGRSRPRDDAAFTLGDDRRESDRPARPACARCRPRARLGSRTSPHDRRCPRCRRARCRRHPLHARDGSRAGTRPPGAGGSEALRNLVTAWAISAGESSCTKWLPLTVTSCWLATCGRTRAGADEDRTRNWR